MAGTALRLAGETPVPRQNGTVLRLATPVGVSTVARAISRATPVGVSTVARTIPRATPARLPHVPRQFPRDSRRLSGAGGFGILEYLAAAMSSRPDMAA